MPYATEGTSRSSSYSRRSRPRRMSGRVARRDCQFGRTSRRYARSQFRIIGLSQQLQACRDRLTTKMGKFFTSTRTVGLLEPRLQGHESRPSSTRSDGALSMLSIEAASRNPKTEFLIFAPSCGVGKSQADAAAGQGVCLPDRWPRNPTPGPPLGERKGWSCTLASAGIH